MSGLFEVEILFHISIPTHLSLSVQIDRYFERHEVQISDLGAKIYVRQ